MALLFKEPFARAWCQGLARTCEVQYIKRAEKPYLERYFVAGWSPANKRSGPSVFLHHFVASDSAAEVHSHPWGWSLSVILAGGYKETRCGRDGSVHTREFRPGSVNVIEANDKHRIELLGPDCWTLFLAGHFEKDWAFAPTCEK